MIKMSNNERTRLVRGVRLSNNGDIQESPLMPRHTTDDNMSEMTLDETELLSNGDRSSILFTLERAVEILKAQVDQEESRLSTRQKPLLPAWLTSHILLITFLIQVLGIGVLEIFHAIQADEHQNTTSKQDRIIFYTGGGIICVIEAAHLVLVVMVSFKLVKQVIHHTASGSFLAQCYLSTVLLFAGIYTLEFRFNEDAWEKVHAGGETHPLFVYLRMMYFSVSTATLCGTSTVEPLVWYSFLTTAAQMLLSFVYFTSILSISIIPKKPSKYDATKSRNERSLTKYLRKCVACCQEN